MPGRFRRDSNRSRSMPVSVRGNSCAAAVIAAAARRESPARRSRSSMVRSTLVHGSPKTSTTSDGWPAASDCSNRSPTDSGCNGIRWKRSTEASSTAGGGPPESTQAAVRPMAAHRPEMTGAASRSTAAVRTLSPVAPEPIWSASTKRSPMTWRTSPESSMPRSSGPAYGSPGTRKSTGARPGCATAGPSVG
ncbi:hypothetical protein ACFFX0_05585 [Citricoccus parietis]|uniref:Uncharacterized protein n=1 Tax=Citricoccus parietis TaxID=592307 RepID=A0ABV5FVI3_9MICC